MLPTPISIKSVNKNTAKAIISALFSAGGVTRGELAARCGVSAMTAGKVVRAMCEAGYAAITEEIGSHGRISEFIYPTERFTFLVFDIGERSMWADVIDARGNTRLSYSQPRNHGIDVTEDVSRFVALVKEQIEDIAELRSAYTLSALLCHSKSALDANTPALCDISLISERTEAAVRYIESHYPEELVAFVGARDGADITLISKGEQICGKRGVGSAKETGSELDMLSILTSRLGSLFELICPDRVIIDSRSLHLSRRFSAELCEHITERRAIEKEELPEIITNDGIPFPSRAVIGQLINIYADIIPAS